MHLFVDNLTNVDFSYLHPQRGLVGETWLASIVLEGALDDQGMVCDFGIVKKTLREWLDQTIDHCLLVAEHSPCLHKKELTPKDSLVLEWLYKVSPNTSLNAPQDKLIYCRSPKEAITLVNSTVITPETVATWCIEQLSALLPDTIDRIQLSFTSETITHEFYHYSHGLKKHNGNCQRIAHGHRSTIEIYHGEERQSALEKEWCQKWKDIYIGSKEDLVSQSKINNVDYYTFAYTAQQGEFELRLPQQHCYLIETDSTVEFIAKHIALTLKAEQPDISYTVRAFEGIGKGAIAFS